MTSQFIQPQANPDTGFRAWNFQNPLLGNTSVLLESGGTEIRSVLDADSLSMVVELNRNSDDTLQVRNWHVAARKQDTALARAALLSMLDIVFTEDANLQTIVVGNELQSLLEYPLLHNNMLLRQTFYQWPELWLKKGSQYPDAAGWVKQDGVTHPQRAPQPEGEFYRRFVPSVNKVLSFRVIDLKQDLDVFHQWMNHPKIAPIWELGKPKEELAEYLKGREKDPHIFSALGCFDDEPFGYFELYWTAEDRLGPYYDADQYDRGLHLLVGNRNYLGRRYFYAWFTGLTHFMFLDDVRTQCVLGEPRADNRGLLQHMKIVPSYRVQKEFDFPHKRAALVECTRQRFFQQIILP